MKAEASVPIGAFRSRQGPLIGTSSTRATIMSHGGATSLPGACHRARVAELAGVASSRDSKRGIRLGGFAPAITFLYFQELTLSHKTRQPASVTAGPNE